MVCGERVTEVPQLKLRATAIVTTVVLLSIMLSIPAYCAYSWSDTNGPLNGDYITCLEYDSSRDILYAGTWNNGVWRCTDPGDSPSWTNITGTGRSVIYSLAYDSFGNHLFAGTDDDVWRLTNPHNTANWVNIDGGVMADSNVPSLEYARGSNVLFAGTTSNVWRLNNPHTSSAWQNTGGPAGWINALLFNDGTLYVGLPGHQGVRRCDAPFAVTPLTYTDISGGTFNETVVDFAFDDTKDILYAAIEDGTRHRVYRCSNPDDTPPVTWAILQYASGWLNGVTYDADDDILYEFGEDGVYYNSSPSDSTSWADGNGSTLTDSVRSLLYDGNGNMLYAGTSSVGVWSSVPEPVVSGLNPAYGEEGTSVTVTGTNFGDAQGSSYVSFGSEQSSGYTSWSNNQIVCDVPPGIQGAVDVTVTTAGGTSNGESFTVTTPKWYLAEGSTDWGFDCYISVENPNGEDVTVDITYMTKDGPESGGTHTLPAESQTTFYPRDIVGDTDFSTYVECTDNKTIAVDRTMSWTGTGAASPDGHCSIGVTSPATTWYLPEGSSSWGFESWLLIQNPNATDAICQVTYMTESKGSFTFEKKIPANSRSTYNIAEDIGEADSSIKVTSDKPVIPERAMYRNSRREGHDSIGTTTPATDYYLAEGTTAWGFTTYVLVQNPNNDPVDVTVTYMTPSGPDVQDPFTMEANSRKTIRVNDVLPNTDLSTQISGTDEIIAERAMYWNNGTGEACHDSIGMYAPHETFYLPDGQASDGRETWTLVQNPNDSEVTVKITYLNPDGADNKSFGDTIPANSRKSYYMPDAGITGRASILVTSETAGRNIMVERAMYWNSRGAGTDTIGGYSD